MGQEGMGIKAQFAEQISNLISIFRVLIYPDHAKIRRH